MKFQNLLIALVITFWLISLAYAQCPGGGELKICVENPTSNTFDLEIESVGYCWDFIDSEIICVSSYERNINTITANYRFDAPKSKNNNIDCIPWGKFKIKIISHDQLTQGIIRSFYLDLRDENWSQGTTYSDYQRDTWIMINQTRDSESIYLLGKDRIGNEIRRYITVYDTSSTINIWTFMGIVSPNTSNFKVPVTLNNKIENTETSFGFLKAGTEDIFSGDEGYFKYNTPQSVENGTLEKYNIDVRNYSYKWSNSDYVTPQAGQNFYNGIFNFTTVVDQQLKSITRNFRPVYPLTIKNISPELGSTNSFGNVLFKDPTTDNQFHSYSAIGTNGFEKNEAFEELNERIGDLFNQKYSVKAISPISYNSRNYYWQSGDFNPTTQTDLLITAQTNKEAYYKGTQLSNQTNAYSNTSQRRFIQTPDGVKHICYESMNKVWIEHSTDNGTTWFLGNGGKPLSSADAKNPSMSFYANQIGIVWQENNSGATNIKFAVFYGSNYSSSVFNTVVSDDCDYTTNSNPVVEWGYNGKVVVVWSGFDMCANAFGSMALKYAYGSATSNGISWLTQCAIVGTDANSINPTITANYSVYTNPFIFHFAWQQVVNTSTSKINYCKLYADANNNLLNTTFEEASLNSGYSKNFNPVIVLKKIVSSEYIYVTWLGYRTTTQEEALNKGNAIESGETRVLLKYKLGSNWSVTGVYGTSPVQNFSINKGTTLISNQEPLALSWSEPNGSSFYNKLMKSPGSGILTLNSTGKDLQINNGTTFSSMFVNSFSSVSLPYSFNLSQNFGSINKENSLSIFNGREGVVGKEGAQFYFALGDISVNGQNINFITVPDTLNISNLELVNNYFESEPFTVNSSSNLVYGVQYGITDSLLCTSALSENEQINFKVELVDNQTNEVLGLFDEVTYSKQNVYQYNNIGYQVNLSGIGDRTVKFRLVTNTNAEFGYSLSNRTADQNILAKGNYQTVNYQGNLTVTEYNLEQNYPNPFNPSTTIKFQLPTGWICNIKSI